MMTKRALLLLFSLLPLVCCASNSPEPDQRPHEQTAPTSMYTTTDIAIPNTASGHLLRGTLYRPSSTKPLPLIITAHELGADALRPWWVNYAHHWASQGYAVLSVDFAGGGARSRSEGKTTEMSVLTEVSDLEHVLAQARSWDFVDTNHIILAGGSQGGGVATIVASRHAQEIAALILLYPAYYLPDNLRQLYPNPNQLPETTTRNGMITIGKRYITDMYHYDYRADMRAYSRPVLIVHGDADQTAPISYSQEAVKIFPQARLHVIPRAGHVFTSGAQQEEFLTQVDSFLQQIHRPKQLSLTDYEAIHQLIVSERIYRVSRRSAELAQCYTEDAQIHTSWQQGGVSSFVSGQPAEARSTTLPNVNRCNPPLIHLHGSKAFVEYPSTTIRGVMVHGQEAVLTSYMRLLYRVEKRAGQWKITAMTAINEWDTLEPAIPGQNLRIKPKDLQGLRISYRWLAYTRKLAGGTVNPDELGTDRPEELARFYQQEQAWLREP